MNVGFRKASNISAGSVSLRKLQAEGANTSTTSGPKGKAGAVLKSAGVRTYLEGVLKYEIKLYHDADSRIDSQRATCRKSSVAFR